MTHVEKELWKNSETLYEQFCHKLKAEGEARGEAKGLLAGVARGKAEGLRTAIRDLCDVLNIPLSDEHTQMLTTLDAGQLELLRLKIKHDRHW